MSAPETLLADIADFGRDLGEHRKRIEAVAASLASVAARFEALGISLVLEVRK